MTNRYRKALMTITEAQTVYDPIVRRYRAGLINDTEYLQARKIFEAARAAYDAEYDREAALATA